VITRQDLAAAVAQALSGEWTKAHEMVQQDEDGELACWIHAVLHRQEGDLSNARYWYARCGRQLKQGSTPEDELREIQAYLGNASLQQSR
jgi:hypothetical protein